MKTSAHGPLLVLPDPEIAERTLKLMTQRALPYPPDEATKYGICQISGLIARYRDPRTGQRYGSIEALRKLRAEAASS